MRIYSILIFIFLTGFAFSQSDLRLGLYGGPDFSLLEPPADSIIVESIVTPFFGVEMFYPMQKKNHIRFGASYTMKSSKSLRNIKYRNSFISVYGAYYYSISDQFFLTLGPQYSVLINARSVNGSVKEDIPGYDSYMSINAGIDFQLQPHLNLGLVYEYPINNPKLAAWPSIKVKLSLIIDKELFKVEEKKSQKEYSEVKRKELKRTALLVSLRGYKKQLEALEQIGDTTRIRLIEQKRDMLNRSIIEAFTKEFDFCPVYYFYNYDTKKIKERDFNNIFINNNLEKDSTILFSLDTFLIGELGYAVTDTTKISGHSVVYKNGFNRAEGYATSSTIESDIAHYGFYIRDQNFSFIDKPFPSFIRGYFLFAKRSNERIVRQLNSSLKELN